MIVSVVVISVIDVVGVVVTEKVVGVVVPDVVVVSVVVSDVLISVVVSCGGSGGGKCWPWQHLAVVGRRW